MFSLSHKFKLVKKQEKITIFLTELCLFLSVSHICFSYLFLNAFLFLDIRHFFLAVGRIQIFKLNQNFQFQIGLMSKIFFQNSGQNHFQTSGHWNNLAFRRFPPSFSISPKIGFASFGLLDLFIGSYFLSSFFLISGVY